MSRLVTTLCLATTLALTAAACANDDSGSDAVAVTASDLAGRTFLSTSTSGHDLVKGTEVRLAFDEDRLSGSAGCNTLGGSYTVEDSTLRMTGPLMMTEMGCDPERMDQDQWLSSFLTGDPALTLEGDKLTLTGGDVTVQLTDEATLNPPRDLVGTTWSLESVVQGDVVSSVPLGVDLPTLTFDDQGNVTVFTGCNQGGAGVEIGESNIAFGPMRLTKMACHGDANDMEQVVTSVLQGDVAYEIDGDQLTLTAGATGLGYRAG